MINLEKYYPYKCKCCGECCRHINLIPEMSSFNRGDNVCKYLNKYNKCSIYTKRPDICNGEKSISDGAPINAGYMVLCPEIFNYIEGDNTVFEREPLEKLAEEGQLMSYMHKGFWQCMD